MGGESKEELQYPVGCGVGGEKRVGIAGRVRQEPKLRRETAKRKARSGGNIYLESPQTEERSQNLLGGSRGEGRKQREERRMLGREDCSSLSKFRKRSTR